MTTKQIKTEFHRLIDNFEDEKVLNNFYEAILEYSKRDKNIDIIDELSEKQKQRLMDSVEQVREGNTMSHDKVKDEIEKMEYEIRWTENAFEDLREIVFYLEEEWSSKISHEFLEKCFLDIDLISNFPYLGIQSEKDKDVRKILVTKQNALYYRIEKNTILLLNFFDTRQDPGKNKF